MALSSGQALGNYRILSRIGVGGMGMVYLAEHPLIGKKVALKVIHHELARNKEVVARFFREAKAVNTIGHEHIVEINDFGQTSDGDHFLIMEYLQGRTLADLLGEQGVLPCPRAAHISAQISSALGAAHAVGIIHRDLKPDNVMLVAKHGQPDFVKLLDFGLAKMLVDSNAQQLTAQGVVLGTPQYMSPEACESKKNIDARADIYSLGVLMFQMMTGELPFSGPAMGEILVQHVTQPPPAPRGINPDIPPAVEQVVLRCLAKDPDARFPTMSQLRDALLDPDRYLASSPPVVPSAPQARTMFGENGPPIPGNAPPPQDAKKTIVGKRTGQIPAQSPETPVPQKRTLFLEGGAPPPAGSPPSSPDLSSTGPQARTAFMDPAETPGVLPPDMPDMPQPMPAKNATMVIGTPHGYSNSPPAKRWPLVVALLAILAVGGVTIAILVWPDGDQARASSTKPSDGNSPGEPNPEASDTGSGDAAPAMAKVTLTSNPAGATIMDEEDNKLGVTPTVLEFPSDGSKRVLQLRHPKAKARTKTLLVTGDVAVTVQMEPLPDGETPVADASNADAGDPVPGKTSDPGAETGDTKPGETKNKRKKRKKRMRRRSNGGKTKAVKDDGVIAPDFDE